jgi:DNA-binding NtrC family response regulator
LQRLLLSPLLGPALVFYLLADVAASRGGLPPFELALGVLALALSFARRGATGPDARTARLLGWLGLCAALVLLRSLSQHARRLSVDLAEAAALCGLGALTIDLALSVPDQLGSPRLRRNLRSGAYALALASFLLTCFGWSPSWLASAAVRDRLAESAPVYAALALFCSVGLRLARRRLGGSPEAFATNVWGLGALAPACAFTIVAAFATPALPSWLSGSLAALSSLTIYLGHVYLVDARRRMSITRATRGGVATALTILVVASLSGVYAQAIPPGPFGRALWAAGLLLFALGLFFALRRALRHAFAPDGGRLLDALTASQAELGRAQTLEGLVGQALLGLRAGTGTTWSKPILYGFDPLFEGSVDAAGAPHLQLRAAHPMLRATLHEHPGDLIVRSEIEGQLLRRPALRPLLEALLEQDALCVVPLVVEGEPEGALVVPRGGRRAPLTAEEQRALWEFSRYLAGMLATFSSKARAEQRANLASLSNVRAAQQIGELEETCLRLTSEREVLYAERSRQAEAQTLIAYSEAQRELVGRLSGRALARAPLLFVSEPGVAIEPLARLVHNQSHAAGAPFVVLDCAALRSEHADAALFGGSGPLGREVGALAVAASGSLLLVDVPALPLAVQRKLALALVNGRAERCNEPEWYKVSAQLMATSLQDLLVLANQGRCAAELADHLVPHECRVPALRDCGPDVPSLVLLAIDRACRRYGRGPIGIEADALAALRAYDFPGNHVELDALVDRAVAAALGLRLTLADFAAARSLAADGGEDGLRGSLEEIERRALVQALMRAGGNKSEAARLLGLPRTTLLDKLRRHKLVEAGPDNPRAN